MWYNISSLKADDGSATNTTAALTTHEGVGFTMATENCITIPTKSCSKCLRVLPATTDYFYKKPRGLYGLYSWCKQCFSAHTKVKASQWQKDNRERSREIQRRYHHKNAAQINERTRQRTLLNPVPRRERVKRWRLNNPTKRALNEQKRRARKRTMPNVLTLQDWQYALDYFHGCCAACGRQLNEMFGTHTAAMDHWIPLASSECPGTVATNIVPLCHGENGCNNSKRSTMPEVWLINRFGKRKAAQILKRVQAYFDRRRAMHKASETE